MLQDIAAVAGCPRCQFVLNSSLDIPLNTNLLNYVASVWQIVTSISMFALPWRQAACMSSACVCASVNVVATN